MPIPLPALFVIFANLVPIGAYFGLLGVLHAIGRPMVVSGVRDFVLLALALSGLMINGPIDYILHIGMLPEFLVGTHWIRTAIYAVLVAALVPRGFETLIVYNRSEEVVGIAVRCILNRLGISSHEVPGGWIIGERGLSIELDSFAALRNVTLRFRGLRDKELYRQLQVGLSNELAATPNQRSFVGLLIATTGVLVLAMPVWIVAHDPQSIAALFREVFSAW